MSRIDSDIDIDVPDREHALSAIGKYTKASMISDSLIKPHNVGVYLQDIPNFMDTGLSSIDYKKAPEYGFFKIDVLTNTVYEGVKDEMHLERLLDREPNWDLLLDHQVVKNLFQINRYEAQLDRWKPNNVLQLAMFIAMIRPSKKHLLQGGDWGIVEQEIWIPPTDGSQYFKKSHAIAYASAIVVQLNLISGIE